MCFGHDQKSRSATVLAKIGYSRLLRVGKLVRVIMNGSEDQWSAGHQASRG